MQDCASRPTSWNPCSRRSSNCLTFDGEREHGDAAFQLVDAPPRVLHLHFLGDGEHPRVLLLRLEEDAGNARVFHDVTQVLFRVQEGRGAEPGVLVGRAYDHAEDGLSREVGRRGEGHPAEQRAVGEKQADEPRPHGEGVDRCQPAPRVLALVPGDRRDVAGLVRGYDVREQLVRGGVGPGLDLAGDDRAAEVHALLEQQGFLVASRPCQEARVGVAGR